MDPDYRGFRPPNPFKVTDLSGIIPDARTTRPGSEQAISSGSTEFQAALDTFSRMKINETKRQEEQTTKSVEESIDTKKLVQRRQSLSEFASVDMAKAVSRSAHKERRKSLPSLGLVAVDIQYSIPPSKKNSRSYGFPSTLASDTAESKLYRINEILKKEANSVHSQGTLANSFGSRHVGGSSNLLRTRRFSVGAKSNKSPNTNFAFSTKQRRASCLTCNENSSTKWRVLIHQRSLNIDDCDSNLYNPLRHRNLKNPRTSLTTINSNFAGQTRGTTILPTGRRSSLVA